MTEPDDLTVAVAFEHAVIYDGDIEKAMRYAHPDIEVIEAPTTPYRAPIIGANGLVRLREDVTALCEVWGRPETEYFLARPGLVVGRIRRQARLRATGEEFDFRVTEWLTIAEGLVRSVEVYYFENAPLARAAEIATRSSETN